MTQEWTVTRGTPDGEAIVGDFDFGSGPSCSSLERVAVAIPEGRYRVALTVSGRATRGELWAPYPDHRLPELLQVPGRTAARIHAFNTAKESLGCIGVGTDHTATEIEHSRPAVTRVVNELVAAERNGDEVWLTVRSQA